MATSLRPAVLVTFLIATIFAIAHAQTSTSPPPPPPAVPAGWTTVTNTSDLAIQQVGQFAVRIYALSTGKLRLGFVDVVSGRTQPFNGGFNYQLVITVSDGPAPRNYLPYNASVWGILGTMSWKLWSFTIVV
ncbi:hypothetical protein ZWY2020_047722 [Hordeum vulgare]|nr:hypothetical protein ZWY2020_047722 [Hordeum vulgare]